MQVDLVLVEETAKELYIRALKILPPDIKRGFDRLAAAESDTTARSVLGTMITNIEVAEHTDNLLCQDTGVPIYNVLIGRGVAVDGFALKQAEEATDKVLANEPEATQSTALRSALSLLGNK